MLIVKDVEVGDPSDSGVRDMLLAALSRNLWLSLRKMTFLQSKNNFTSMIGDLVTSCPLSATRLQLLLYSLSLYGFFLKTYRPYSMSLFYPSRRHVVIARRNYAPVGTYKQ